tara:strand:+ start:4177 stop:4404 length:228 start_codon:yes stop_codon:yes gene_type:complete
MPEGSYVASLLAGGWEATARKVLEEAAETVIAAKEGDCEQLAAEAADLIFHLLVLLEQNGTAADLVWKELENRRR